MNGVEWKHELKCWPQYYGDMIDGAKRFEVRKDDRAFSVGDVVRLREYVPKEEDTGTGYYTGREAMLVIVTILRSFAGLAPGYCVFGFIILRDKE